MVYNTRNITVHERLPQYTVSKYSQCFSKPYVGFFKTDQIFGGHFFIKENLERGKYNCFNDPKEMY